MTLMTKKASFLLLMTVIILSMISCDNSSKKEKVSFQKVEARKNATDPNWKTYTARTIDRLPAFDYSEDPETSAYGGWKTFQLAGTGFYRVEKRNNRWWIIDPEGYPFIHKGVAVFRPGRSDNQKSALKQKYGSNDNWAVQESQMLKEYGFNGAGAWSAVDLLRQNNVDLAYTVIINPMGSDKREHIKKFGGEYEMAVWQGYRYDLAIRPKSSVSGMSVQPGIRGIK
jgi:hypothetical protein